MLERTLRTVDGVDISAALDGPAAGAPRDRAFIVAHGFTGHRRQPRVRRIIEFMQQFGAVVSLDFRGHGTSGGLCTVGLAEIHDVAAGVTWARDAGFEHVTSVGFSMGGAVVLRQAALHESQETGVNRVVSVSGPAFWYYRGTAVMRLVHGLIMNAPGRLAMRTRGVRLDGRPWPEPPPIAPVQAMRLLQHTPSLIVHGDQDRYFPLEHAHSLQRAGTPERTQTWIVPGFGHAEAAIDDPTLHRIGAWALGD
jgi:pimeloyl-ACP methyl ester carboxylesterase